MRVSTTDPVSVMVDHEPFMMSASINVLGDKQTLCVYLSTMVDSDSEVLGVPNRILDQCCTRLTEKTLHKDEQMYHGEAWEYQYLVFDRCPADLPHRCVKESDGREGRRSASVGQPT